MLDLKRSKLLLFVGIGVGILGLGIAVFGMISVMHTSKNVSIHQRILDEMKAEAEEAARRPRSPQNQKRLRELSEAEPELQLSLYKYKSYRNYAFVILTAGILVVVVGGVCILVHFLLRFNSSPDERVKNEADEEEEIPRKVDRRKRKSP